MNIYSVEISERAQKDIDKHLRSGNVQLVKKMNTLLAELTLHPRKGTGQPEQMRYTKEEQWSRRINHRHRLVYNIEEDKLVVVAISAYGHYGDK